MVAIRRLESLMDNALAWGNIDRIDSLCWNLLVEFLVQRQTKVPSFTEDRMQMLRVAAWMRTHCGEALTLDSVVRQFNLSRTSFFRKWSRCFSDTPGQYLQGLRLQEARRLLKATELRVFEIAERLNYPSASYFSAVFRQEYGLTPFAYRKSKDMP